MKKSIFSFMLVLCMLFAMLPTLVFAASTITPTANTLQGLQDAINRAQSGDTVQLAGDITTQTGLLNTINVDKTITLDLNNYTIYHKGIGTSINSISTLFKVTSNGTLTLQGGNIKLDGNYSNIVMNYGKLIVKNGTYSNTATTYGGIFSGKAGELSVENGNFSAISFYTINARDCKLSISGGTITNTTTLAVSASKASINISGGTITGSGSYTMYSEQGEFIMSGGEINNTGWGTSIITKGTKFTMTRGTISANYGMAFENQGSAVLSNNANITTKGVGVLNFDTLTLSDNANITTGDIGIINKLNFTMEGGKVNGGRYGLESSNPIEGYTNVSSGEIFCANNFPVFHDGAGTLNISGGTIKTTNGQCVVINNIDGFVSYTGGTLEGGKDATFVNNYTGSIRVAYGNIPSIKNYNAQGKIIVDGGSVKTIQGATPQNSTGQALVCYPIYITGKASTPIANGDLTFNLAVEYIFDGVSTDANSMVYPWLPSGVTNATYKSGSATLTGGVAEAGKTTVLPNTSCKVTVYKDGVLWTENPPQIILSKSDSSMMGSDNVVSDSKKWTNGVYTFSGLATDSTYYIWGPAMLGQAYSQKQAKGNVDLHFYTIKTTAGDGISFTNTSNGVVVIENSRAYLDALVANNFTFKEWKFNGTENILSTDSTYGIDSVNKTYKVTANAILNVYNGTIWVKKDNAAWTDFAGSITLSTDKANIDTNKVVGTLTDGAVSFEDLDPRVTYYVWADGVLTDETISASNKTSTLDYYSIKVTAGDNISSVSGNAVVLKGGEATIDAVAATDKIFSRWQQTTGRALYSTTKQLTINNITTPISLTAVGSVDKYNATVTINLNGGNNWRGQGKTPKNLVLSTSQTECGTITGSYSEGKYTFSKLSGTGTYYIWDADTMQCVDTVNTVNDKNNTAVVDYYTVKVTNEDSTNITGITGEGVYLKGSTVTLSAKSAQYYKTVWSGNGTADESTYILTNITKAETVTVSVQKAMYTGSVTLILDSDLYTGQAVTLQTGTEAPIATTELSDEYRSASQLDPTKTYKVLVNGADTGAILTGSLNSTMVLYYTISVRATGVNAISNQIVLAGRDITLTATPNSGYDFVGWYDDRNKLMSTELSLKLTGVNKTRNLTAKASNTFDAVITVLGVAERKITLTDGTNTKTLMLSYGNVTFADLTPGTTYRVLEGDNNNDTGFTVSKNAPNVTLQFYGVSLTTMYNGGISSVTGNGWYLAGSSVTIHAETESNYAFSCWRRDGSNGSDGTIVTTQNSYTIPSISDNMGFFAIASGNYSGGELDVSKSGIVIADSATPGKIKISYNGTDFDSIEPNTNIIITGGTATIPATNNISVTTQYDVLLTLKDVNISCSDDSPLIMKGSGTLTVDLAGTNSLTSGKEWKAGLHMGSGDWTVCKGKLIIQSNTGTGSLTATGGGYAPGIGSYQDADANITINSGTIVGNGNDTSAGIGSGSRRYSCTISINGGIVTGTSSRGAGIGAGWDTSATVTINGGTVKGISTDGAGIGASSNCGATLTINGGTVTGTSTNGAGIGEGQSSSATLTINGGNISGTGAKGSVSAAINAKGEPVYKTTFTAGTEADTDVSKTLVIRDKNGTAYGMHDAKTFAGGSVFAYLPEGTAGAVYSSDNYAAIAKTDGTGVFSKIVESSNTHTVSVPAPKMVEGITATGMLQQVIPTYVEGATVTLNVTLSGKALKSGKYTVSLVGINVTSTTPSPLTVTVLENVNQKYGFTFTMPSADVSDLALVLTFEEDAKYTVTYSAPDATSGTVPVSGSYYQGQKYFIYENPGNLTKTCYTFAGWGVTGEQTMGTQSVTLVAQWTPDTYTVTFNSGSGTGSMTDQTYAYGVAQALKTNEFTRDGYTFAGWSKTSGGAKAFSDKENISITENTNLYALWKPMTYTISFNNGGGSGAMETQTFNRDETQELNANTFTRQGYTFNGWKDGSNKSYFNGESIKATANMTLTAQWTAINYTVRFNPNGGTGSLANQSFAYGTAQALTANTFTHTGYTFVGWSSSPSASTAEYGNGENVINLTVDQNDTITLYAVWIANSYTVNFVANCTDSEGTLSDQNFTYDIEKSLTQNTGITRKGYTFVGWNTMADGSGVSYADMTIVKNLATTGTVSLYAQWSADVYTLTFESNGGMGTMVAQTFATGDTTAIKANAFTKAGHSFIGWKDDKNVHVDKDSTVDSVGRTATMTAQWEANSYIVSFNSNGGTGSMLNQTYTYGLAQALTPNTYTRDGYTFAGWSQKSNDTTTTYGDQVLIKNLTPMKDVTITLYAIWKQNTYTVDFNANGGEGTMADQIFLIGVADTLKANSGAIYRVGHKFTGWNTMSDGSGTSYPNGAVNVSFVPDASGKVNLYAMWTEETRYIIRGNVKDRDDSFISGATLILKQGNIVVRNTATREDGYYVFTNILPGQYNLITVKADKTVTTLISVEGSDVERNITLPTAATKNSVLVVNGEANTTPPAVVVGGLETVAETENDNIIMNVTAKVEDDSNQEHNAIKIALGSQKTAQILDITLKKGGTDIGSTNTTVLEIVYLYDFSGKTDIKVWRYHGGTTESLTKLLTKPVAPFTDGKYYADNKNGLIYVYASKFSTYAISYSDIISTSGGESSSSGVITSYSVMVKSSQNGDIKVDRIDSVPGGKVTLTVAPDIGYDLMNLSVIDNNGKNISYTDNQNGTFTFTMPYGNVSISAVFAKNSGKKTFIDVAKGAYYYDAVIWAQEKGITTGVTSTTFAPDGICDRAQAVTFLWRAMGSPEPSITSCQFTDVKKDTYYYKAVLWATEKGITVGTSPTTFSPHLTVNRSQTATFLWRTAGKPSTITANPFIDVMDTAFYHGAVLWAVEQGVTQGTGKNTFSPIAPCTRAQIVTFLYRYLNN